MNLVILQYGSLQTYFRFDVLSRSIVKFSNTGLLFSPDLFRRYIDMYYNRQVRLPKWLTFHFHTTSQFRIPKFALRISEFGIVKYI